jgi:hypothetical protein
VPYKGSYTADKRGIGEMLTRQDMRRAMQTYIAAVHAIALSLSPTSDREYPQKYINCFRTETGIQTGKPQRGRVNRRAYAMLENTSDHARFVEYGANGVRRSRVMRNALDALGPADSEVVKEKWDH